MRASVAVICALLCHNIVTSVPAQTAGGTGPNDAPRPARDDSGRTESSGDDSTRQSDGGAGRVVPVRRTAAGKTAGHLIVELLPPAREGTIAGDPKSLLDLVAASADPVQQDRTVRAYWDLAIAIADHHCARELLQRNEALARHPTMSGDFEKLVAAATARARADADATLLAVREAQFALLQRQPSQLPADLPLPSDRPHVGAYRMYFDRFFGAAAPPPARQLHETLPLHHELIQSRAAAVLASRDLVDHAAANASASVQETLALHQTLGSQYRAFLDSVRRYNLRIAEYARLVSPGATDPRQFVAMLVTTEPERLSADIADRAQRLDDDGLMSVLTTNNNRIAEGAAPSGVVPATAEAAAEDDDWKSQAAPQRRDGFVPRHPDRE